MVGIESTTEDYVLLGRASVGTKGHWRGDKQCTMTKTANLAVKDEVAYRNSVQEQATSSNAGVAHTYMLFEDDEPATPTAMLAYRTATVP